MRPGTWRAATPNPRYNSPMRSIWLLRAIPILLFLLLLGQRNSIQNWLFDQVGEETLTGQLRGAMQLALFRLHQQPDLRPDVVPELARVNPYGINTFLEQEVEPAKRARQVNMLAAAGFHWVRQEFPWYDIEIHGKGDFEDRRHPPARSAWEKYDNIVELVNESGLELIVRLGKPPAWARAQQLGDFAPPDSLDDFVSYVRAVAERYQGKVHHYQIWNEPNIYPEWGEQAVNPIAYTQLLCASYQAIKAVDPQAVVLAASLAPTLSLTERDESELTFLERMYAAGAGNCFDVMGAQAYGLWSAPSDSRLSPTLTNFSRHLYLRDIMVQHGDAHKAIWLTEMNWATVPSELATNYGRVTAEQQARYLPQAFTRAREEWHWIGAMNIWFLKRADDSEKNQSWYYFYLLDPNFTPQPAWDSMKEYIAAHPYP